jgi:hypothetical protein
VTSLRYTEPNQNNEEQKKIKGDAKYRHIFIFESFTVEALLLEKAAQDS